MDDVFGKSVIEPVVDVEHPPQTRFGCPECGLELGCYDHSQSRDWRHLDSCQFKTILRASLPRVKCPEHGVRQISVPRAEGNSRFTMLFESFAINLNLSEKQRSRFDEAYSQQLETGKAWAYKELLRE